MNHQTNLFEEAVILMKEADQATDFFLSLSVEEKDETATKLFQHYAEVACECYELALAFK